MINNYVSCEDCKYQNFCENFDSFFGCSEGMPKSKQIEVPVTLIESVEVDKNELQKNNFR